MSKRVMKSMCGMLKRGYCKYSTLIDNPKYLVTGALGQIGSELVPYLREKYGDDSVISTGRRLPDDLGHLDEGPYKFLNFNDKDALFKLVEQEKITSIIHLGAFLSATAEVYRDAALKLQTEGMHNIFDAGLEFGCQVFSPSSIAAFGPTTPLDMTPDLTSQRPRSIYGVGKVYCELLGEYYAEKHGLDFRSLRYPGIISWKTLPGGGSTDFSVEMYHYAIEGKDYECYIGESESLPFMYMDDCVIGTVDFLNAPEENLTQRTYNVTAMALTPADITASIQKEYPDFNVTYEPDDLRNPLVQSWPNSLDDSKAREDWNYQNTFDLDDMTKDMIKNLKVMLNK